MCEDTMKPVLQNLVNNLRALRGFVEAVEPTVLERADTAEEVRYSLALALEYIFRQVSPDLCSAIAVPAELLGLDGKDIRVDIVNAPDEAGEGRMAFQVSGADADDFEKAVDLVVSTKKLRHLQSLVNQVQSDQLQMSILYRGALISLISQVQAYLGTLFEAYLRLRPEALNDEQIALADLMMCESMDDAREIVLSRRVEGMLHGGLEDWRDEIKRTLGCNLSEYADRFDADLTEIYQRRNLLVHADGIVNAVYLANVDAARHGRVRKGDHLEVTREYLDHAIDVFELAFVLLAFGVWKRLAADEKARSGYAINLEYDYLLERRWTLVEAVASFTEHDPGLGSELSNRVNLWLALKRQGRFAEVESEIRKAADDFNTRRPIFRLVRHALLEEHDQVVRLLPSALLEPNFDPVDVAEWPVLDEFRQSSQYRDFLRAHRTEMSAVIGDEDVARILADGAVSEDTV